MRRHVLCAVCSTYRDWKIRLYVHEKRKTEGACVRGEMEVNVMGCLRKIGVVREKQRDNPSPWCQRVQYRASKGSSFTQELGFMQPTFRLLASDFFPFMNILFCILVSLHRQVLVWFCTNCYHNRLGTRHALAGLWLFVHLINKGFILFPVCFVVHFNTQSNIAPMCHVARVHTHTRTHTYGAK